MTRPNITVDFLTLPWTSYTVERSLGAAVGTFGVTYPIMPRMPIRPGPRAVLNVPAERGETPEPLMVGFIEAVSGQADAQSQEITISGRDVTADMLDGYHEASETAWSGATLLDIAQSLASPFGIGVEAFGGAEFHRVARLARQPGESAYETLERATRQFGVLIGTGVDGRLLLGAQSQGEAETRLVTGSAGNVTSWSWSANHTQRFNATTVQGANDGGFGELLGSYSVPTATAIDPEIRPQRQKQFVAQGQVLPEDCERLAAWHVSVARARSSSIQMTVPSWRQSPTGRVWRPGLEVPVELTEVGEGGTLLVDSVRLSFSEQGEEAALVLIRPDSLLRDPSQGVAETGVGFAGLL